MSKKLVKKNSPCIGICKLDTNSNLCLGCFRSADEIAKWPQLDNEKALQIMEEIKDRYLTEKLSN
ncbi:DUF1289 domain-containing protein [Alphaproteobacteria bacterium]|nr:DUF1289 domain-containing protein [Alphaproteobacteria bacterium]